MKSVYIFGASNAFIRNGWQSAFSEGYEVDNSSMGASCSGLGVYTRKKKDFSDGDLVIIESSVSDQDHIMRHVIDKKHLEMYISAAYSGYSNKKVKVISLIMPTMFGIDGNHQEAIEIHRKHARLNGITFINAYSLLNRIKLMNKHFYHACFRDVGHLHPSIAKIIGEAAQEIAKYEVNFSSSHDNRWNESFTSLSVTDIKKYNDHDIQLKGSSLLKLPTIELKGENIISLGRNGYLMGFLADVSNSNCNIVIESNGSKVIKNINTEKYAEGKSQFRYICLQEPLRFIEDISVSCVTCDVPVTESTLGEKEHESNVPISAHLCGFLLSDSLEFQSPYLVQDQDFSSYDDFQNEVVEPILEKYSKIIFNALSVSGDIFRSLSVDFKRLANNDADVLRELAKIYAGIGEFKSAEQCIEAASLLRPNGPLIKKLKHEIIGR